MTRRYDIPCPLLAETGPHPCFPVILSSMSDLTFAQSERRSFLVPALASIAVLAIACALAWLYVSQHTVRLSVTHVAVLPTHTVFPSASKIVGHKDPAQDDLYVLATLRVDNSLRSPAYIKDITATLTASDGTVTDASAVEKQDLDDLYLTFPALKPLSSAPLVRETAVQPGGHAEGMVILNFPATQADWNQRKSADVTVDFYQQSPLTVPIPKP